MRNLVHKQIFFISCLLLAFFIPVFPRVLPAIILIMVLNWLVSGIYLTTLPRLIKGTGQIRLLWFTSLYILYMIGMLYSADYGYGWFDLEVKMSLFIFPVIFATSDLSDFDASGTRFFSGAYIAGCLAGSLLLFGHAWLANDYRGVPNPYYYTNLSWYYHSSYLAMYYTFGIGIALVYLVRDFKHQAFLKTIFLSLVITYLEVLIFLLSSKAGVISLVLTELLFLVLLIWSRAGAIRIILFASVAVVLFFSLSWIFPFALSRMSKADSVVTSSKASHSNPEDGTVARMAIWKVSIGLIRENFMFGVGTGDVKDALIESYRQHHLYPILKKKLNAHNQYLQTFIAIGFCGFMLLALSLFVPAFWSLKKQNSLYFVFIFIFALNILFESMLENQAGVVFYAFFNAFLFSKSVGASTPPA